MDIVNKATTALKTNEKVYTCCIGDCDSPPRKMERWKYPIGSSVHAEMGAFFHDPVENQMFYTDPWGEVYAHVVNVVREHVIYWNGEPTANQMWDAIIIRQATNEEMKKHFQRE